MAVAEVGAHSPLDNRAAQALRSNPSRARLIARLAAFSGEGPGLGPARVARQDSHNERRSPLPSVQAVQGIGRNSLPVLSPLGQGHKAHTSGAYMELPPSLVIIVVHDA